jgi:hypothetical protein
MGYCSDVLRFASPSMALAQNHATDCKKNESLQQKPRLVTMPAVSPKTSRTPGYSAKTPSLGQRLCAFVKNSYKALHSARLEFAYKNACQDGLIALDLALSGGSLHFSKGQLLNLAKSRERQVVYLKSQDPKVAKDLDAAYHLSLIALCKDRKEELRNLYDAILSLASSNSRLALSQGFIEAKGICKSLEVLSIFHSEP